MRICSSILALSLLVIPAFSADVNVELASLLNAQHAAALVPAVESRIRDVDPSDGSRTFGMNFKPDEAFSLEEGSFKKAMDTAKISDWALGMNAPWSGGKRTSWVILDQAGHPFLSVLLTENQPDLLIFNQVTSFDTGVASRGRNRQYFFWCEIRSKELVSFFRKAVKQRAEHAFVPLTEEEVEYRDEDHGDDPFVASSPKKSAEQDSAPDASPGGSFQQ